MTDQDITKPAVIADSIVKTFRIPLEGSSGLKQKLINNLKGRRGYREFTPLNTERRVDKSKRVTRSVY